MSDIPPVTLLVPCHNAAAFLPRLFESVRAQTVPFAAIICYDDCSADNTSEVARELGAAVVTAAQNRGSAHARNQLWQTAVTDWVHFHDADDLLDPRFLELMAGRIDASTDVIICSADWRYDATRQLEMQWLYSERDLRASPVAYLLSHPVGGINGLYRRTSLAAIQGFSETLTVWEDADLHVRLAASGARFAVVEQPLVTALRRKDSVSAPMQRNWQNRFAALTHYSRTLPPEYASAIAAELETAARNLLRYQDARSAREALRAAMALGADVPTTSNPALKLIKHTLGRMTALRIQTMVRN